MWSQSQHRFEEDWPVMQETIAKVICQEPVSRNAWLDLIRSVHSLCYWDETGADKALNAIQNEVRQQICKVHAVNVSQSVDATVIEVYLREWKKYEAESKRLSKDFQFLDAATHTEQNKSLSEGHLMHKVMMHSWREELRPQLDHVLRCTLKLIFADHVAEDAEQLVSAVRESLVLLSSESDNKLQFYKETFERGYTEAMESFYIAKAASHLATHGIQNYLRFADSALKNEEQRAWRFLETKLNCNSVNELMTRCANLLVASLKETLMADCLKMIQNNDVDSLCMLSNLMKRSDQGSDELYIGYKKYLDDTAEALKTTDCDQVVGKLVELVNRSNVLLKGAFREQRRFLEYRDAWLKDVVNSPVICTAEQPAKAIRLETVSPEMLAKYYDKLLKKTMLRKGMTSVEVDQKLHGLACIVTVVKDKEYFIKIYKSLMSRRLIHDWSANREQELLVINELRQAGMPTDHIRWMARMLRDVTISENLSHATNEGISDRLSTKFLSSVIWRETSDCRSVALPPELGDYCTQMEQIIQQRYCGRRLVWNHGMSNGMVTVTNDVGKYDLILNTFQMAVLLAFNSQSEEKITYENLKLATRLPDLELRKTLSSLMNAEKPHLQLLNCDLAVQTAADLSTGTFSVNRGFCLIINNEVRKRGTINLLAHF